MRVRRLVLLSAIVSIGAVACSRDEPVRDSAEGDARSSTVLPAGGESEAPVASAVETHTPPPAPLQPRAATAPASRTVAGPPAPLGDAAAAVVHAGHMTGGAAAAAAEVPSEAAEPGAEVAGGGSGKPRPALNEGPIPDPYNPGRVGVIIIRGGNPGVHDDCKLPPMVGEVGTIGAPGVAGGALINDRSPPGGALINDRGPAAPAVGSDPVASGDDVLNSPDPRRGVGVGRAGVSPRGGGIPVRGGGLPARGGGIPRRGGIR